MASDCYRTINMDIAKGNHNCEPDAHEVGTQVQHEKSTGLGVKVAWAISSRNPKRDVSPDLLHWVCGPKTLLLWHQGGPEE